MSCAVHGDDFTFCGEPGDLDWITVKMKEWFEIKVRATLGSDPGDDKEVAILGGQLDGGLGESSGKQTRSIGSC